MPNNQTTTIATKILASAARLVALCEGDAPSVMVETERLILTRLTAQFPMSPEAMAQLLAAEEEMHRKEREHLTATGFYKSLEAL